MIGENSFIHSLVFGTTEGLIYTCNENHSFFFFRPNCPPSVGSLVRRCCAPKPKVGLLLFLLLLLVMFSLEGRKVIGSASNTVVCMLHDWPKILVPLFHQKEKPKSKRVKSKKSKE